MAKYLMVHTLCSFQNKYIFLSNRVHVEILSLLGDLFSHRCLLVPQVTGSRSSSCSRKATARTQSWLSAGTTSATTSRTARSGRRPCSTMPRWDKAAQPAARLGIRLELLSCVLVNCAVLSVAVLPAHLSLLKLPFAHYTALLALAVVPQACSTAPLGCSLICAAGIVAALLMSCPGAHSFFLLWQSSFEFQHVFCI